MDMANQPSPCVLLKLKARPGKLPTCTGVQVCRQLQMLKLRSTVTQQTHCQRILNAMLRNSEVWQYQLRWSARSAYQCLSHARHHLSKQLPMCTGDRVCSVQHKGILSRNHLQQWPQGTIS